MTRFTNNFWFGLACGALVLLLLVGNLASGQVVGNDREPILLSGMITCSADNELPRVCPFRLHYVNLVKGRTYAIRMESSDFYASLVLEDIHGRVLARDDDYYDELYGMIVFRPMVTGDYRLVASSREPIEGFYTITIREMPVLFAVEAMLEPANSADLGAHERTYDVALTAGRRYVIDVESQEFDAYVKLLDADGVIMAFEDECSDTRTARIVFTPTVTATYRVVATSSTPGAAGAFRMVACAE